MPDFMARVDVAGLEIYGLGVHNVVFYTLCVIFLITRSKMHLISMIFGTWYTTTHAPDAIIHSI